MADTPSHPIVAKPIVVGRFGAPHGVRGEVRLQSFTGDPLAIAGYGPLAAADGRSFTLAHVRHVKDNMLVARVAGIATREAAQALTNLELSLDRAVLPPPDEDEFYVADLVGLAAVDADGKPIGTVIGLPNYGGGDLIEVRPSQGGESLLFPFTKLVVPAIDFAARQVTIVAPGEIDGDEA